MLINIGGHSKKITFNGWVGHCSPETAKELKKVYGKLLKVENTIKTHKERKSGPCVSMSINDYLKEVKPT